MELNWKGGEKILVKKFESCKKVLQKNWEMCMLKKELFCAK